MHYSPGMIRAAVSLQPPPTAAPGPRRPAEVISLTQRRSVRTLVTAMDKVISSLDRQLDAVRVFRQNTQALDREFAKLDANWTRYQGELAEMRRGALEIGARSRRLAGHMTTCEARLAGVR